MRPDDMGRAVATGGTLAPPVTTAHFSPVMSGSDGDQAVRTSLHPCDGTWVVMPVWLWSCSGRLPGRRGSTPGGLAGTT